MLLSFRKPPSRKASVLSVTSSCSELKPPRTSTRKKAPVWPVTSSGKTAELCWVVRGRKGVWSNNFTQGLDRKVVVGLIGLTGRTQPVQ